MCCIPTLLSLHEKSSKATYLTKFHDKLNKYFKFVQKQRVCFGKLGFAKSNLFAIIPRYFVLANQSALKMHQDLHNCVYHPSKQIPGAGFLTETPLPQQNMLLLPP